MKDNMRNRVLIFCFLLLSYGLTVKGQKTQVLLAQNSVGKLQVSIDNKEDAKKQLAIIGEGIKAIELAQKDKKTKNWPETWAIKAYLSAYIAVIDENDTNSDKYFVLANKALDTAKMLDKFQANGDLIKAAAYNINVKKLSNGNKAYAENDFQTAYSLLKEVSDALPTDTTIAINVALAAQNSQDHDEALKYFLRAKQHGVINPVVYQSIANTYASKFETDLAIKTLEDGLKVNPYHPFLTNDYINLLLDYERYDKALKAIETSIGVEKRSKLLYFLFGYLQQAELKNRSTAELAYEKALELDQNYFNALYQLALVYLENANEALKQNQQDKYKGYINRAEFTLLRAHEINVNDQNSINLLIEIYTRKNRFDKVQELRRVINQL